MTCRSFESQTADWLGQRLSLAHSEEMAAHQKICASCALAALAEAEFRERWHEGAQSFRIPDVWPRLAQRLETQEHRASFRRPRWAMAAGMALAVVSLCYWTHIPGETTPQRPAAATQSPLLQNPTDVQSHADTWSALGTMASEDPAVDDPVGTSVENMWTCLKTDSK